MIQNVVNAILAANQASLNSPDEETKVGAVLLNQDLRLVASSWNGFIDGHSGVGLPTTRPHKYNYMLHAERKLLFDCARQGIATEGHSIVCTLSPCPECLRAMWQSGVTNIYFRDRYRHISHSFEMTDLAVQEVEIDKNLFKWSLRLR